MVLSTFYLVYTLQNYVNEQNFLSALKAEQGSSFNRDSELHFTSEQLIIVR